MQQRAAQGTEKITMPSPENALGFADHTRLNEPDQAKSSEIH